MKVKDRDEASQWSASRERVTTRRGHAVRDGTAHVARVWLTAVRVRHGSGL